MKQKIFITTVVSLIWHVSLRSQEWIYDPSQSYNFNNTTDKAAHDSRWNCGTMWGGIDKCGNTIYPPNNPILGTNDNYIWDVNSVSSGANQHVKYVTEDGYDCLMIRATSGSYSAPSCPSGIYPFMTGQIFSNAMFGPYGKIEIRTKLPKAQGLWPAFWLFENGTEYDVFEVGTTGQPLNIAGQALTTPNYPPTIWSNYNTWHNKDNGAPCSPTNNRNANLVIGTSFHSIADLSEAFHVYSYECTPTYIKVKLDGELAWMISRDRFPYLTNTGSSAQGPSCTGSPQDYWPQPMKIKLGMATFNNKAMVGNPPVPMTPVPGQISEWFVDYIKVYTMGCQSYVLCDENTTTKVVNTSYQVDLSIPKDINYDGLDEIAEPRSGWSQRDPAYPFLAPNPFDWNVFDVTSKKRIGYYTGASVPYMDVKAVNAITMHPGFVSDAINSASLLGIPGSGGIVYRAQIAGNCSTEGGDSRGGRENLALHSSSHESPTLNSDIDITIAPNPGNGIYSINCSVQSNYILEILDVSGKKTGECSFDGLNSQIDITKYDSGMYLFKIRKAKNDFCKTFKIIKN